MIHLCRLSTRWRKLSCFLFIFSVVMFYLLMKLKLLKDSLKSCDLPTLAFSSTFQEMLKMNLTVIEISGEKLVSLSELDRKLRSYIPKVEPKSYYLAPYSSTGAYFRSTINYPVVVKRSHLKCISGENAVPLSSQWNQSGYYYPIQIAQYGLASYNSYLTEKEFGQSPALVYALLGKPEQTHEVSADSMLISRPKGVGQTLPVIHLSLWCNTKLTISLRLEDMEKRDIIIEYTQLSSVLPIGTAGRISYHIGCQPRWRTVFRDYMTDITKALNLQKNVYVINSLRLMSVTITGDGRVRNASLKSSAYLDMAAAAADFMVNLQNSTDGGFPINVVRKFGSDTLAPGWYSGMAQGCAISLLSRMYAITNRSEYKRAVMDALAPFKRSTKERGVAATVFNNLVWFEEYPTEPPSLVLNGFMYGLVGLYDAYSVFQSEEALGLLQHGFDSLERLLPLFDTGYWSLYDLKHLFHRKLVPSVGRSVYHSVHLAQLGLFCSTLKREQLCNVFERWYMYATQWNPALVK